MEFQIARAEDYYDKALRELPSEDFKQQRAGLMMAAIYRTLLREILRDGAQKVLNARISLGSLRKLWLVSCVWMQQARI